MGGMERVFSGLLAGVAILFALGAFGVFAREYNSFYAGAGMRPQDYVVSEGAFAARPVGLGSIAREVERCFVARAGLQRGVLNAATRERGYRACLGLADAVLLGTPAHGGALQLRAEMLQSLSAVADPSRVDSGLEDFGGLSAAIAAQVLAAAAAPNTVWLMQRRLLFALALPEALRGPLDAGQVGPAGIAGMLAADLPKLISLEASRAWLAQVYLRQKALRPLVAALEGRVMARDLAAFMAQVEAAAR